MQNPDSPDCYLKNFAHSMNTWPHKRKQLNDIEVALQSLDDEAWIFFKPKLAHLLMKRDKKRGWQALFDKLSEAKAYKYLKCLGYSEITFIPEQKRQKTPDLRANNMLCEVKTINVSENEIDRRQSGGSGKIMAQLNKAFFNKLKSTLEKANIQMTAYSTNTHTKKIAYIVVNFDDLLHEYVDNYQNQINQYINEAGIKEMEIVFDIKPAFYAAQS